MGNGINPFAKSPCWQSSEQALSSSTRQAHAGRRQLVVSGQVTHSKVEPAPVQYHTSISTQCMLSRGTVLYICHVGFTSLCDVHLSYLLEPAAALSKRYDTNTAVQLSNNRTIKRLTSYSSVSKSLLLLLLYNTYSRLYMQVGAVINLVYVKFRDAYVQSSAWFRF